MVKTAYAYTMNEANEVAKKASDEIEKYLRSKQETINIINVENDPYYRSKGIDLIWEYEKNGVKKIINIEVKGDRWYKTGNYFFEIISNEQRSTPGCFLYSEADYLFYYFIEEKELHIIPLKAAREWFLKNIDYFQEKRTSTPTKDGGYYNTVGKIVSRDFLNKAIKGIKIKSLNDIFK